MLGFDDFFRQTDVSPIGRYHDILRETIQQQFYDRLHGEFKQWYDSYAQLPDLITTQTDFSGASVVIGTAQQLDREQHQVLVKHLQTLHPWRKGPWDLFGISVDAEWRSNLKWDRLVPHITSLRDRLVLDIGCGNGYYGFRMLAQKPAYVLGIDPSQQFLLQFRTFKKYAPALPLECLPMKDEHLPMPMPVFDTVFSMGVLYHRREPMDHLNRLRACLKPGGELVLESLIIDGGPGEVLKPADRYAQMANVFAVPSCESLTTWLADAGFVDIRIIDKGATTSMEQRSTEWMRYQSLRDFLDPADATRTIEGYPAPMRAIFVCRKRL